LLLHIRNGFCILSTCFDRDQKCRLRHSAETWFIAASERRRSAASSVLAPAHSLDFLALALELQLISSQLLVLLLLLDFLALQLIADQRTRAEPKSAAHRRADARTAYCCPDQTAGGGSAEGSYSSSLLPGREGSAGTSADRRSYEHKRQCCRTAFHSFHD
jgi:hypothetical protein